MKTPSALRLASACWALVAMVATAEAQPVRFVATTGSDANPCTRILPCRTLQRGVLEVPVGGEVQILDSGEYDLVYISRSVTISADGVSATIAAAGAGEVAVIINKSNAVVTLRNLMLTGGGTGGRGIVVADARAVSIDGCQIERFTSDGVQLTNLATDVFVANSVSRSNGGRGLFFQGISGAKLRIENSRFEANATQGVQVAGPVETSITNSIMAANGSHGFSQSGGRGNAGLTTSAQNAGGGFVVGSGQLTLEDSWANGNASVGLGVSAGAIGRISSSAFTNNGVGISNAGQVQTRGNNTLAGNTTPFAGNPLTPLGGI